MTVIQETHAPVKAMRNAQPDEHPEIVVAVQGAPDSTQYSSAREGIVSKNNLAEAIRLGRHAQTQFAYPAWPTSKPGPQVTSPLPGQKPHPKRTDQMVYGCYDQEQGRACVSPATRAVRKMRGRVYLPDDNFLEVISEAEAVERWRDDGNASETEAIARWLDDGGTPDATFEMGELLSHHIVKR
ncbi:hypothetical protein KSD_50640 [Ktedonobacter sp. SOSP1-85]|uniref:hypothetical protein n=1 Tax=Ktedonobacter sp. SOSP1-85 TaxID=2778367 RepID=UPI0019157CE1|nr:hypothetical protein [Ktedonobacter sp. SOSP1-85]GHO77293.1 hypothetical protein KSD_50640 [Ktedonobacter sp. SOSP1-85]